MSQIKIYVTGSTGTGKTALAKLISIALKESNIDCDFVDPDGDYPSFQDAMMRSDCIDEAVLVTSIPTYRGEVQMKKDDDDNTTLEMLDEIGMMIWQLFHFILMTIGAIVNAIFEYWWASLAVLFYFWPEITPEDAKGLIVSIDNWIKSLENDPTR